MNRLPILTALLVCILTALPVEGTWGSDGTSASCMECHQDVYMKTISYRYQHSVVKDQCSLCHIKPDEKDNVLTYLTLPALHWEWLIHLDQLTEDRGYEVEVAVRDSEGRNSSPNWMFIFQKDLLDQTEQGSSYTLNSLSGVHVDSIEKRSFVRATISWDTDVFASSEIEYGLEGDRESTAKLKDLYTKHHIVVLDELKHDSTYYFRAVSRDVHGNTVTSEQYTFNTSVEHSGFEATGENDTIMPAIERINIVRTEDSKDIYLKVTANKLSEISVRIKEIGDKHGYGLLPAQYTSIDVCYKCHVHGASHPVGVKAVSSKIKSPDGLPTIENGIITCVTCHKPHGGENLYYSRFDFKKNLCMRCHLQKYSM